jgi:hypothetical protein
MSGLRRRLDALEAIAEECRRREIEEEVRDVVREHGLRLGLSESDIDRAIANVVIVLDHWTAAHEAEAIAGGSYEEVGARLACELGLISPEVIAEWRRRRQVR